MNKLASGNADLEKRKKENEEFLKSFKTNKEDKLANRR